jgi:ABC-2 type transport system permease protein
MQAAIRALVKLSWLEMKIFVREPLGLFGTVGFPVLIFVVAGRLGGPQLVEATSRAGGAVDAGLPVMVAIFMAIGAVGSLVTIISIYREGGILKRLRATPLSPLVILSAQVIVKLLLTALTLTLMILAGRRFYPVGADVPLVSFGVALVFSTWAILALGFLIASLVPTARFAQPIAAAVLYPMIAVSGLFFPVEQLPPPLGLVARVLPFTYAVTLLDGIWRGDSWAAHTGDVAALVVIFAVLAAASARFFRWE